MGTDKKQQCYPLSFIWRKMKSVSVTPYIIFDGNRWKMTYLPLTFYLTATDKERQCYPLSFTWRKLKMTYLLLTFYLMANKKRQVYPLRCYLMSTDKKRLLPLTFFIWQRPIKKWQCYPLSFIWRRTIKNDSFTPCLWFDER